MTTTKIKDILKGLRYISHVFDNDTYKEKEMQIGYPTDVKHVAHIGWDGPSVTSPSWMNEFRPVPEFSSAPLSLNREAMETTVAKGFSEDLSRTGAGIQDFLARDMPELPKPSRRNSSTGSPSSFYSPTRDPSKQSRRRQSGGVSINSPLRDSPDSNKPNRRSQNSGVGLDSPSKDSPNIPKQSRRRKSKGSSGGGSTRASKSKGHSSSLSDPGSGLMNNEEIYQTSTLKPLEEEGEKSYC